MMQFADRVSLALISQLVTTAARSFVLAGAAAAGLAGFRARATSLRLFTWTAVLYASLVLPLLGWLLPPVQVSTPEFLQHRIARTTVGNAGDRESFSTLASRSITHGEEAPRQRYPLQVIAKEPARAAMQGAVGEGPSFSWTALPWNVIAAWIYVPVTLFFLARFATGIFFSRRLVQSSELITEGLPKLADSARCLGPRLAASQCISVPVTVGAFRPIVLLPPDWREWDGAKLDAVLAHEFSHVTSRDALTQRLSLLYRSIFWFNPLAWWINRHLAALAEQASDEAALSAGADQNHYARTLLSFFEALRTAPRRIRWEGVSIARPGQAEQRVERILAWKGTVTMSVKRSLAVAIVVFAIPVVYLAASVHAANANPAVLNADGAQEPAPPRAPSAPPVGGISSVAPVGGIAAPGPIGPIAPIAPTDPMTPLAPAAPIGSGFGQSHSSGTGSGKGFSYAYGFDDEERFVIVSGKSDSFTMSGSTQDARHVEKLRKQIPGDFIWFQRDEKSYIIRDQATIDRAKKLWAPQEELGKKQEELGKQQAELGKQQEELGAKMEQVKVNVPDMTAELDRLKAKLQKLGPTASMEQIGDVQSEIGELQSKLGEIQSQAGEQQSKVGEQQGALGEKQGKLGELQGELGRQQAELAEKASHQMKELIDEAIKNGTAKPEPDSDRDGSL